MLGGKDSFRVVGMMQLVYILIPLVDNLNEIELIGELRTCRDSEAYSSAGLWLQKGMVAWKSEHPIQLDETRWNHCSHGLVYCFLLFLELLLGLIYDALYPHSAAAGDRPA